MTDPARTADEAGAFMPSEYWSGTIYELARFAELIRADEREKLRSAGSQLANVAFNLAQKTGHVVTADDAAMLDKLRRQWDAAIRASR